MRYSASKTPTAYLQKTVVSLPISMTSANTEHDFCSEIVELAGPEFKFLDFDFDTVFAVWN